MFRSRAVLRSSLKLFISSAPPAASALVRPNEMLTQGVVGGMPSFLCDRFRSGDYAAGDEAPGPPLVLAGDDEDRIAGVICFRQTLFQRAEFDVSAPGSPHLVDCNKSYLFFNHEMIALTGSGSSIAIFRAVAGHLAVVIRLRAELGLEI